MNLQSIRDRLYSVKNALPSFSEILLIPQKPSKSIADIALFTSAWSILGGTVHAGYVMIGANFQKLLGIEYNNISEMMITEALGASLCYAAMGPTSCQLFNRGYTPTSSDRNQALMIALFYLAHSPVGHQVWSAVAETTTQMTDAMYAMAPVFVLGGLLTAGMFAEDRYKKWQETRDNQENHLTADINHHGTLKLHQP